MNFSVFDLREEACSTRSRIFAAVDSPAGLSARTRSSPLKFTKPESTCPPAVTSRGSLSPVNATVFRLEVPSRTVPSIGTFSPGRITTVSPTSTSSGSTLTTAPSRSTFAVSGRISISCEMERLLLPSATPSRSSPTWKKSITNTASANMGSPPGTKPMSRAPIVAMHIRKSSSKTSPSEICSAASFNTSKPAARYGTRYSRSLPHSGSVSVLSSRNAAPSSAAAMTIWRSFCFGSISSSSSSSSSSASSSSASAAAASAAFFSSSRALAAFSVSPFSFLSFSIASP